MIVGARQGTLSGLRRLVAVAMARDLGVFVIPGPEIARAHGLDIEAAGMQWVVSPRHASVLMVIGAIPPSLREAAAVIYAQMVRPRALFVLGTKELSPLPAADVVAGLSQQELIKGVRQLRTAFAEGAFRAKISAFDAPMLHVRIEYTCSMHPEVVQDEPGSCPKCGMTLIPRETQASAGHVHIDKQEIDDDVEVHTTSIHDHGGHHHMAHNAPIEYTCPMHPEVIQNEPGSCPKCGMNLEPREVQAEPTHGHHHMAHDATVEYTCPMHPEVVQGKPGSCPKCGMNLEPREAQTEPTHDHHHMAHDAPVEYTCSMHPEVVQDEPGSCPKCGMNLEPREIQDTQTHEHAGMDPHRDHSAMDHGDMGFMSMIDVTKDLPRSSDGLPMEWIDAPFGPFFPGLPGGLLLTLTLDGDTVAGSDARSVIENVELLQHSSMDTGSFITRLTSLDPLAPVAYRLLACRALENAAGVEVSADTACARIGALERERIASHLGWLVLFGQQTGFDWLMRRAASLQSKFLHADIKQIIALKPAVQALIKRLQRTPLLKSRTVGVARLAPGVALRGPVARATGNCADARSMDKTYTALGFTPVSREGGDAQARLYVRLDEIIHSIALIKAAGAIGAVTVGERALTNIGEASATAEAVVETPRGMARLQLTLEKGQVIAAQLETPSTHHITLVDPLIEQQALGNALVAVGSLDLSPWEVRQ
ncbi:MAG: hypothetical protein BMS9Abin08_1197 [Gammaproteobacteria bacterium]|nr:MAG: hypothetical protein BMS9Abin08_1197 [Gammaproteobacteria bacterium]